MLPTRLVTMGLVIALFGATSVAAEDAGFPGGAFVPAESLPVAQADPRPPMVQLQDLLSAPRPDFQAIFELVHTNGMDAGMLFGAIQTLVVGDVLDEAALAGLWDEFQAAGSSDRGGPLPSAGLRERQRSLLQGLGAVLEHNPGVAMLIHQDLPTLEDEPGGEVERLLHGPGGAGRDAIERLPVPEPLVDPVHTPGGLPGLP